MAANLELHQREDQHATARARYVRISSTKARHVIDLIRGRHVEDARRVLAFTDRSATETISKVLNSAIANAEHNYSLPSDELIVTRAWVDEGPTLRRFRPRALGRATRIRKRTCHISIVVGRTPDEIATIQRPLRSNDEKSTSAKKSTAKKSTAKKSTAKKSTAKKSSAKKSSAKKSSAKKSSAKKSSAKKTTTTKSTEGNTEEES
jgi:large subunit ribosomal protein L22